MRCLLLLICFLPCMISCGPQSQKARNVVVYGNDKSTEDMVLENEFLEFRFLPGTAEIILTEKAGGTRWRSNPLGHNGERPSDTDTVTHDLMGSQFALEYADVSGVGMTLYSGAESVKPGAFHYAFANGGLEVSYTVGTLARTYVVPPAVPEERMLQFLEKMNSDDQSLVTAGYRLYDIDKLRSGDDRAELLALYPDLARRKVYVLRGDTQQYMKDYEELFVAAGYTYDNYIEDIARYPSVRGAEKPAFNITFHYRLEGNSLVLSVPFDRMAYRPAYPITQLSVMPYMGAGDVNDEGYLLVPDGCGALIYFNNGRQSQIAYSDYVYGWDEAMPRLGNAVINDNRAPFPAFGIQKNGKALLCVIEEGASYAAVRADVSGRNSSWNNVYARFDMVHGATMDIASRSERDVYLYESGLHEGEKIVLRYTPCASDGYAGMAGEYRSWLMQKYPSLTAQKEGGVPIAIEIPGAVNKTQHRLGIPVDLPLKLTSYNEATGMIHDFENWGWRNVRIKLNGWFNRSVEHSVPTRIKLISELGSKKDFQKLLADAEKNGYAVYPEADFLFMRDTRPFDGFSLYRDAARYVNRERIEKYPYSFVWFGERVRWGKLSYLARPAFMISLIDGFKQKANRLGLNNIAFRNMASNLAGDYNERRAVSREASVKLRQEKLDGLSGSGTGILLNTGFAYAAPWADFITDMAIDDQGFGITDVSVPFYPMVLHGLVPYTGRAINLAEDYTKNLLKTVESGAGLYFSFMIEESAVLQETKFRQFYANEYGKWAGDANALYRKFTADFSGLYNQAIVDHKILSPGVTLTVYENGTGVVVNMSGKVWTGQGGITVNADDYIKVMVPRGGE